MAIDQKQFELLTPTDRFRILNLTSKEEQIAFLEKRLQELSKERQFAEDRLEATPADNMFRNMQMRHVSRLFEKIIGYTIHLDELKGKSKDVESGSPEDIQRVKETLPRLVTILDSRKKGATISKLREELEELPEEMVDGYDDVINAIDDYEELEREGMTPSEFGEAKQEAFDEIQTLVEGLKFYEGNEPMTIEQMQASTFTGWKSPKPATVVKIPVLDPGEKLAPGPAGISYAPPKRTSQERYSFPTRLTMAEYNEKWKPQGWKIIFIGPTATWRSEWGTWEAIREIVQNALDETEAYEYGYDQNGLYISDKGKGVGISNFLLGPPKLKDDWSRGKYGEGMKIGGLAMIRQGYPVYVETVGRKLFMVFLEQETDRANVETLAALWKESGNLAPGTTFHIINYTGDSFADRFAVNLPKDKLLASVPGIVNTPLQRYNQLYNLTFKSILPNQIEPDKEYGRIYARDIFMQEIKSPFSYNLWGFDLAPDRHAARDESQMWRDVGRVWCGVTDITAIKVFLMMVADPPLLKTDESHVVQLDWLGSMPGGKRYSELLKENAEVWKKAWNEVFGADTVIRTQSKYDSLAKHLGYKSQSMSWNVKDSLAEILKTDAHLIQESQEKLREVAVVRDEDLEPLQQVHLRLARAIVAYLERSWSKTGGVRAAIIPPASDRVRTAGMYGRSTQEIFIATEQLLRARNVVDTTIHEMAHHISEAEDGEKKHYDAISELAGRVVKATADQEFDGIIQDPNFKW
ncbi:MAG: hypothetical protein PHU23_13190 [Dehalococcoidales bacterium]|nr:hypothetical protein [Dehalococcoidales bacterium]